MSMSSLIKKAAGWDEDRESLLCQGNVELAEDIGPFKKGDIVDIIFLGYDKKIWEITIGEKRYYGTYSYQFNLEKEELCD